MTDGNRRDDLDDTITQPGRAPLESTISVARVPTDWAAATSIGFVRQANEDRWVHIGDSAFAVADGMGGHVGGELAAAAAVEAFVSIVGRDIHLADGDHTFRAINDHVRSTLREAGVGGGGSTLSAVVLKSDSMSVVNVGDSRVLRLRNGSLDQLTTDHTLDTEMRASGMSLPTSERLRNSLTSYLGIAPDLFRFEMAVHDVRPGDSYLVCSDGVHGQVSVADMVGLLDRHVTAAKAVSALVDAADRAGGRDNATAIVLRF